MTDAVRQLIAAAASALNEDDEDDFQNLVSRTRRSFRRNATPTRGRKSLGVFKRRTLLLRRSNCDYCPIRAECDMLTSHGLGYSDANPTFDLHWDKSEIEEYICSIYPKVPLHLVGFKLVKMDRHKKFINLHYENLQQLRTVLGQSQIVIVPNRDIPWQLTENIVPSIESTSNMRQPPHSPSFNIATRQSSTSTVPISASTSCNNSIARATPPPSTSIPFNNRCTSPVGEVLEFPLPVYEIEHDSNYADVDIFPIIPTISEHADTMYLHVNRAKCAYDMFKYYQDASILQKKLSVTFEGEMGIDGGGLTKELFNVFFKEIENTYFVGEDCVVPYLPLNKIRKEKEKFILIGRILEHMLLLTGNIPSRLSKIMLMQIGNPDVQISKNMALEEFHSYVNPCERHVLKKAVDNFFKLTPKEKDTLVNIFNSYHFYEMPLKDEIFEQIASIALNTLVEKPKQFVDAIRQGINCEKYSSFWERCNFETLLEIQKVTAQKVANCLIYGENLTNEQSSVLHYLEMYIRCLLGDRVERFVFLATGSYQMPDLITVEFNDLVGLAQRPTFSTCTNTIVVPSTYSNYQELKHDFDLCVNSEEVLSYDNY